jgi:hypothetical protein
VELIGVPDRDPGPYDALIDPQTGTLIAAMGQEGVVVRSVAGQWHYVPVGPYARVDLSLPENMAPVLQWELLAAIALAFLMLATMSGRHTSVWPDVLLLLAWVVWTMQLLAIVPGDDNMLLNWDALHEIGLIVTSVIAVPLAIVQTWTLWGTARHALYAALAFTAAAVVLFVFIYWLWSQGSIPLHQTATFLALGEVFVLVVAGLLVINVNPSAPAVARVSVDKSHTE